MQEQAELKYSFYDEIKKEWVYIKSKSMKIRAEDLQGKQIDLKAVAVNSNAVLIFKQVKTTKIV